MNKKEELDKIIDTIKNKKSLFEYAKVSFVLLNSGGKFSILRFLRIYFIKKGYKEDEIEWNYKEALLKSVNISVDKAILLIHNLFENQKFELDDFIIPVDSDINISNPIKLESNKSYSTIYTEWPTIYISFNRRNIEQDPINLCDKNLPFFFDLSSAISQFFDFNLLNFMFTIENKIEIIIPDYRVKFKEIRFNENRISIKIQKEFVREDSLVLKGYYTGKMKNHIIKDTRFVNGEATIAIDDEPSDLNLAIISDSDEILDFRRINLRYLINDPTVSIGEDTIEGIINNGENERIEFKLPWDEKKGPEEFLESVIAFANYKGGIILFGVGRNGNIAGIENPDDKKEKIDDIIANNCSPRISDYKTEIKTIKGKKIILIQINEGNDKPYLLTSMKNKRGGIFIRAGSTDRLIEREELDNLYNEKNKLNINQRSGIY